MFKRLERKKKLILDAGNFEVKMDRITRIA